MRLCTVVRAAAVGDQLPQTHRDACARHHAPGGYTALHYAAYQGNDAIVELLLREGADVNALTEEGATAVFLAAQQGHAGVLRLLIAAGARVDTPEHVHGLSALDVADTAILPLLAGPPHGSTSPKCSAAGGRRSAAAAGSDGSPATQQQAFTLPPPPTAPTVALFRNGAVQVSWSHPQDTYRALLASHVKAGQGPASGMATGDLAALRSGLALPVTGYVLQVAVEAGEGGDPTPPHLRHVPPLGPAATALGASKVRGRLLASMGRPAAADLPGLQVTHGTCSALAMDEGGATHHVTVRILHADFIPGPTSLTCTLAQVLPPGGHYRFRIAAVNGLGQGRWSALTPPVVVATVPDAPPPPLPLLLCVDGPAVQTLHAALQLPPEALPEVEVAHGDEGGTGGHGPPLPLPTPAVDGSVTVGPGAVHTTVAMVVHWHHALGLDVRDALGSGATDSWPCNAAARRVAGLLPARAAQAPPGSTPLQPVAEDVQDMCRHPMDDGGSPLTQWGVSVWCVGGRGVRRGHVVAATALAPHTATLLLRGLRVGRTYQVNLHAVNAAGRGRGSDVLQFTVPMTLPPPPPGVQTEGGSTPPPEGPSRESTPGRPVAEVLAADSTAFLGTGDSFGPGVSGGGHGATLFSAPTGPDRSPASAAPAAALRFSGGVEGFDAAAADVLSASGSGGSDSEGGGGVPSEGGASGDLGADFF